MEFWNSIHSLRFLTISSRSNSLARSVFFEDKAEFDNGFMYGDQRTIFAEFFSEFFQGYISIILKKLSKSNFFFICKNRFPMSFCARRNSPLAFKLANPIADALNMISKNFRSLFSCCYPRGICLDDESTGFGTCCFYATSLNFFYIRNALGSGLIKLLIALPPFRLEKDGNEASL